MGGVSGRSRLSDYMSDGICTLVLCETTAKTPRPKLVMFSVEQLLELSPLRGSKPWDLESDALPIGLTGQVVTLSKKIEGIASFEGSARKIVSSLKAKICW